MNDKHTICILDNICIFSQNLLGDKEDPHPVKVLNN
jgi:hypothetical protein